jgi:hypothetical protein
MNRKATLKRRATHQRLKVSPAPAINPEHLLSEITRQAKELPPVYLTDVEKLIAAVTTPASKVPIPAPLLLAKLSPKAREQLHDWEDEGGALATPSVSAVMQQLERRKRLRNWPRRKDIR